MSSKEAQRLEDLTAVEKEILRLLQGKSPTEIDQILCELKKEN
jgi:DNA-binding CsgD family transcriptional regulator